MVDSLRVKASMVPQALACERRAVASALPNLVESKGFQLKKLPWGIAALVGTSWHRAMSLVFQGETQELAFGRAVQELSQDIAKGTKFDKTTKDTAGAQTQIAKMFAASQQFLRETKPKLVEERFEATIGGIKVIGIVDLYTEEQDLKELKSGGTKPSSAAIQLGTQALLLKSNGHPVKSLSQFFMKRPGPKTIPEATVESYPLEDSEREAYHAIKKIATNLKNFDETGSPYEFSANPQN